MAEVCKNSHIRLGDHKGGNKQILFNKNELTSEQMRELIYSYGNSLHAKDTIGRRVFVKLAMSGYTH